MTRVVIHAGFHKTGTTSAQSMLAANRALLAPHLRIFLKDDFSGLTDAARMFSVHPNEDTLNTVGSRAARFFRKLDSGDPRPVVMSSEDLSGHLPGRHGLDRYDAAPLVMAKLAENALGHLGDQAELIFYFSTRDRDAWLRSTWWQNLRSTRLSDDFETYAENVAAAADLDQVLRDIADAAAPARVVARPLEDISSLPEGPLAPLLDLAGLGSGVRQQLMLLPPENVQPDLGLDSIFLALNRSGFSDQQVQDAKKLLRRMARKQIAQG